MPSEARQKKIMEKLNGGPKMLNFGASKPRVKGGPGPPPPDPHLLLLLRMFLLNETILALDLFPKAKIYLFKEDGHLIRIFQISCLL